jgi:hypothetical protein
MRTEVTEAGAFSVEAEVVELEAGVVPVPLVMRAGDGEYPVPCLFTGRVRVFLTCSRRRSVAEC